MSAYLWKVPRTMMARLHEVFMNTGYPSHLYRHYYSSIHKISQGISGHSNDTSIILLIIFKVPNIAADTDISDMTETILILTVRSRQSDISDITNSDTKKPSRYGNQYRNFEPWSS